MAKKPAPAPVEGELDFLVADHLTDKDTATKEVMVLVEALVALNEEIESLDNMLAARNAERLKLEQEVIPAYMDYNGLTELKLANGMKLTVGEELSATLPKKDVEKRNMALDWLRDHGASDKIKTTATIEGITEAQ